MTDSGRSSILFGIHSESKKIDRANKQNRRFTLIAAAVIFCLIILLMCLIVLDIYTNANGGEPKKQNTLPVHEHLEHLVRKQQQSIRATQNINLNPEHDHEQSNLKENNDEPAPKVSNEKVDQIEEKADIVEHANHRYSETEDTIKERMGFKPRPFSRFGQGSTDGDTYNHSITSIQDIIGSQQGNIPRQKPKFSGIKPVRFRGVYVRPKEHDFIDDEERNEGYFRRINQYFVTRRNRTGKGHDEYLNDEDVAASDLYTTAVFHPFNNSTAEKEIKNNKSAGRRMKSKKKPFTVMLDIYPMGEDEQRDTNEGLYHRRTPKRPKETVYIPLRPGEQFLQPASQSSNLAPYVALPKRKKKKNHMLLKLNLFPRPSNNQRTWNLFQRAGEEEEGGCEILGHNPHGKPISASWRDKNGEIVHAKVVTLNQWDDRSDKGVIDPR